jgi:two-component system, chemotaxis family, protein-glutamate methylesterase/glutaminase
VQYQLVIIGCSLGGLNAMRVFLSGLSSAFTVPIVLVQHRDKSPGLMMSRMLQKSTHLIVEDADDKTQIKQGCLYIAPAGYHLLIEGNTFSLSTDLPVHYAMPSIDVAFETAARSYGKSLVAVVLTSSSTDGAEGTGIVESRGGTVIIQDPVSAENATLPRAAIAATKSAKIAKLEEISIMLETLVGTRGGLNV